MTGIAAAALVLQRQNDGDSSRSGTAAALSSWCFVKPAAVRQHLNPDSSLHRLNPDQVKLRMGGQLLYGGGCCCVSVEATEAAAAAQHTATQGLLGLFQNSQYYCQQLPSISGLLTLDLVTSLMIMLPGHVRQKLALVSHHHLPHLGTEGQAHTMRRWVRRI
jgi:hypothetical protein